MTSETPAAPDEKPSLGRQIVMFPLVRMVLAFLWVFFPAHTVQIIFDRLNGRVGLASDIVSVLIGFGMYALFVRVVERRTPNEIAVRPALREIVLGSGWGVALMSLVVGVLALIGSYRITGYNGSGVLWGLLSLGIVSGFLEELLFRAILFRITEEGLGTVAALVLSSLLFGVAHAQNPGATVWSSVFIAVEAGTLLAAVYLWRRRLWAAIGVHAGWNVAQAAFGAPVSGNDFRGVVVAQFPGPNWLTGGAFGPEAGVIALVVCLAAFAYFLRLALKTEPLRVPAWMRQAQ